PLNRIIVGMPRTPYLRGVCGFSSMLTLATVTLPSMSSARSLRNGAIILQGPHHSAQKSTRTGSVAWSTTVSKLLSLTEVGFIADPFPLMRADIRGAGIPASRRQSAALGQPGYEPFGWLRRELAGVVLRPFRHLCVGRKPH